MKVSLITELPQRFRRLFRTTTPKSSNVGRPGFEQRENWQRFFDKYRSNARKASTQSQVLSRLGELSYENGRYAEAALYLRHALATGACTNAAALYHLAELYRDGLGVEQNLGKYRQLAEKAALLDSPEAKKLLTNLDALRSKRRRNPPANVENITEMRCSGSCKSEDM